MIDFEGIYKVLCVVDGDGFKASHLISNDIIEFRLYGIDAPEIKMCRKLMKDEKESRLAGELLIQLGNISASYLRSILQSGTSITIKQESTNTADKYRRQLCYCLLPDGSIINEMMVADGYAKAYTEYPCGELAKYQLLNTLAMQNKKGLYNLVDRF